MMAILPDGTLTFLFTDIEGSTRLWETQPAAMADALARHDSILQAAIQAQQGHIFRTAGDSFCAAFSAAAGALDAAAMAQQALYAQDWPVDPPLRARMALHTCEAHWQGLEYRAPCLNRLGRLLQAAHGGQTLVSLATYDLLGNGLSAGLRLRNLGEHRLRDLSQAELIYELEIDGLPNDFPRIGSLDLVPNNLPSPPSSFVGRKHELAQLRQELEHTRLLTLTGSGGVGKTRLALQVGAEAGAEFEDGIWFVELAPLADPALVPQAVAAIWQIDERPGQPLAGLLAGYVRARRLLLILDNCEHVIEQAAQLADDLLRAGPRLTIMATSRELLNIAGEKVHRVRSLGLPEPGAVLPPDELSMFEAVSLFTERAAAVQPSFRLTEANAALVAGICWRLDGIPLATELAAALVRAMSLEEISARLEDRFRLLTGGSRTALPRQRTLQGAIDYSYNLLTAAESTLFRRLSIFRGGWTLAAVEAVCQGEGLALGEILDLLLRLVDKSLATTDDRGGVTRYGFLDTLRDYSWRKLQETGEGGRIGRQHLAYYAALARDAFTHQAGPDRGQWLARLEQEHGNLRAALAFAGQAGEVELQLQLPAHLWWFWRRKAYFAEALSWLEQAAGSPQAETYPAPLAAVLAAAGSLYWMRGDFALARRTLERAVALGRASGAQTRQTLAWALRSLSATLMRLGEREAARAAAGESAEIFRELGDLSGLGNILSTLSRLAIERGDYEAAWALAQESCDANRQAGDDSGLGLALSNLGLIALLRGDYGTARAAYAENLQTMQASNDSWGAAVALVGLAELAQMQMDLPTAAVRFRESMDISRQLGDTGDVARCLRGLGVVACYRGDVGEAAACLRQSLELYQVAGFQRGIAECLESFAALAVALSQFRHAARLLSTGDGFLSGHELRRWPANAFDFERTLAAIRSRLGEAAFAEAWTAGRNLTLERSAASALELLYAVADQIALD